MIIKDRRCQFCNWLNKEVQESFVCKNCKKENGSIKEDVKECIEQEIKNWLEEVDEIKGIGPETFADIKRQYTSKELLINDLKENKAPFRNDIVKKLKSHFML